MAVPQNEAAVVRGVAKQSKAAARRAEGMEGNTRTHTARHTHTLDNVFVCAYLSPHPSYSPAYACRRSTQTGNKRRRETERAKERMMVRARGKKVKTNFSIFTGGREEAATGWQRRRLLWLLLGAASLPPPQPAALASASASASKATRGGGCH